MSLLYEKAVQEDLNVGIAAATVTMPDGGSRDGIQIGIHSLAVGQVAYYESWDPGSIAAGGYEAQNVGVPGATVGDFVLVSLDTLLTNAMMISAHVSAADVVKVILFNPTAGAIDIGSGYLYVAVFKART